MLQTFTSEAGHTFPTHWALILWWCLNLLIEKGLRNICIRFTWRSQSYAPHRSFYKHNSNKLRSQILRRGKKCPNVTAEVCQKISLNLRSFISKEFGSADAGPDYWAAVFLCCGRDATRAFSVPDQLSSSELMKLRHSPTFFFQLRAMTFKLFGSTVDALWADLMSWCHRKLTHYLSAIGAEV